MESLSLLYNCRSHCAPARSYCGPNETITGVVLCIANPPTTVTATADPNVLTARQLCCYRSHRPLFDPVSFALAPGTGLYVGGPNGSGKTTLLRALVGLSGDYDGEFQWGGVDTRQCTQQFRAALLYLGHLPACNAQLTALENLEWWAALHAQHLFGDGREAALQQCASALRALELGNYLDTPCYRLSAGQLRRVALARLQLSRHSLWVLDEPFTAIDSAGVARLQQRMSDHLAAGNTLVVTSHQSLSIEALQELTLQPLPVGATARAQLG